MKRALAAAALLLALGWAALALRTTVIHHQSSDFGRIRVTEDRAGVRSLYIGAGRARQSAIHPARPDRLEVAYTRVGMIGPALAPPGGRILFVGLGGGAMPMFTRHVLPDAIIDVVEIDPKIIDVARRFFGFRTDAQLAVHAGDGRAFIEQAPPGTWDVIVLDAFSDDEVPAALTTREFLETVRSRLRGEGVVVSNLWTGNPAYEAMLATYQAVFEQVRTVQVPSHRQRILIAGGAGRPLARETLVDSARALAARARIGFHLSDLVRDGYAAPARSAARVLTD